MLLKYWTNFKVLRGGESQEKSEDKPDDPELTKEVSEEERFALWERRLKDPVLGKYYEIPTHSTLQSDVILNTSLEDVSLRT